ncbi:MAG: ABC transporter ATP-binding protein [Alphaproteobacteria bacterium]|uniref:ABC transporter ATP-binding protein n=1 Tax=Candidatus Nitrobium versatile TaxID=2884831 RepID=A0A953M1Y8_9BACT|nr:ABC transporter ATP-binding protein [Candidatus Nitrobium versatile]
MIQLQKIEKVYRRGAEDVHALRGVDLRIDQGEFVSIVGPSGAGKTTLLHILGCLDSPTRGSMVFDDIEVDRMRESELVEVRRKKIGFIFQQFYLIPGMSVFDNVSLPLLFSKKGVERAHIESLIGLVGLGERLHHVPGQLSGGEMQRVAVARALVNSPEIILADEPTGNLDTENSELIFQLLSSLNQKGLTVIMITHNNDLASRAGRVVRLKDGQIEKDRQR